MAGKKSARHALQGSGWGVLGRFQVSAATPADSRCRRPMKPIRPYRSSWCSHRYGPAVPVCDECRHPSPTDAAQRSGAWHARSLSSEFVRVRRREQLPVPRFARIDGACARLLHRYRARHNRDFRVGVVSVRGNCANLSGLERYRAPLNLIVRCLRMFGVDPIKVPSRRVE